MGTGILYAVIVVAWAAYLVPLIRSHRRESAPARSVDAFATSMRVLGRRSSARPGTSSARVTGPAPRTAAARARAEEAQAMAAQSAQGTFERACATRRRAARRRRTTLLVLLALTLTVAVLAYVGLVPWWSVAVPGGLALVFLGGCVLAVRRMRPLRAPRVAPQSPPGVRPTAAAPARRVEARPGSTADAAEKSALADAAAWVADSQLGAWEPHPVSLPQYVTAAPAVPRAVRTMDLGEESVFSAGRLPETDLLRREPDTVEELARSAVDAGADEGDDDSRVAAGA